MSNSEDNFITLAHRLKHYIQTACIPEEDISAVVKGKSGFSFSVHKGMRLLDAYRASYIAKSQFQNYSLMYSFLFVLHTIAHIE